MEIEDSDLFGPLLGQIQENEGSGREESGDYYDEGGLRSDENGFGDDFGLGMSFRGGSGSGDGNDNDTGPVINECDPGYYGDLIWNFPRYDAKFRVANKTFDPSSKEYKESLFFWMVVLVLLLIIALINLRLFLKMVKCKSPNKNRILLYQKIIVGLASICVILAFSGLIILELTYYSLRRSRAFLCREMEEKANQLFVHQAKIIHDRTEEAEKLASEDKYKTPIYALVPLYEHNLATLRQTINKTEEVLTIVQNFDEDTPCTSKEPILVEWAYRIAWYIVFALTGVLIVFTLMKTDRRGVTQAALIAAAALIMCWMVGACETSLAFVGSDFCHAPVKTIYDLSVNKAFMSTYLQVFGTNDSATDNLDISGAEEDLKTLERAANAGKEGTKVEAFLEAIPPYIQLAQSYVENYKSLKTGNMTRSAFDDSVRAFCDRFLMYVLMHMYVCLILTLLLLSAVILAIMNRECHCGDLTYYAPFSGKCEAGSDIQSKDKKLKDKKSDKKFEVEKVKAEKVKRPRKDQGICSMPLGPMMGDFQSCFGPAGLGRRKGKRFHCDISCTIGIGKKS